MQINLEDKYKLENGIRFLTGTQALVRIPLVQIRKDNKNNLKTAYKLLKTYFGFKMALNGLKIVLE